MKMNKNRALKEAAVTGLRTALDGQNFAVVVEATGLTVAEISGLRGKIRAVGAGYRVTKNTLARMALKGTPFENLVQYLKGPTAIAYSKDPVGVAKALVDFAKGNERLKLIAANLDGNILDAAATRTLASLPPLNVLRARIVAMISTPATRLAVLASAPAAQIARVLAARARQEG